MKSLLVFLLISNLSYAKVLKHQSVKSKIKEHSFKEVCEEMGAKNLELISLASSTEVECLNKKFSIFEFCLKKYPLSKTFSTARAFEKLKKVECEMSDSVMISISCDEKDMKYCLDPKHGCEELKKIYGNRLEIAHYSMMDKNLNCYFSREIGESFNEN